MHARLTRMGTAVSAAMLAGISCSSGPPPAVAPAASAAAPAGETPAPSPPAAPGAPACDKHVLVEIDGKPVWKLPGGSALGFKGKMTIDADGAPNAYHKDDTKGLDRLANAGREGKWWALVTSDGKPTGKPVVQGPKDPSPGYYVSMTALEDTKKPVKDPRRYVDSTKVAYIALPAGAKEWGAKLGDFAAIIDAKSGRIAFAIFADIGPKDTLGEGSIALASALNLPSDPRAGGADSGISYVLFPGSGNGQPRSSEDIDREGKKLFDAFGGRPMMAACLP
ncbi:MAG: glycoside hydrolase family 75 protein [Byssovorax sp.]